MHRYEVLMLSVPEITSDETSNLEKGFDKIVRDAKGTLVSFERWGKYRLAFPIRKNDYGIYFLARLEVDDANSLKLLDELKSFFAIKVNDLVVRNMVSKLDMNASLVYQRPRSLEEAATARDVNTFLKENKMEGLLPGSESAAPKAAAPTGEAEEEVEVAVEELDTDKNGEDNEGDE